MSQAQGESTRQYGVEKALPGAPVGLRIGVMGPLLLMRDGAEIPVGPPGQRAVLALLALGSPVSQDSIIDVLWGEKPPRSAVGTVQTYISRLRALLEPLSVSRRVLVRDASGYRLRVTADELDMLTFRSLAENARRANAGGDPAAACGAYELALSLWRGDPLADIAAVHGHPTITALAAERAAVIAEYADLASARGWHDRVLPHLRTLARGDPLDERAHARLMIALAGCGRQAEALRAYDELRRRLDHELGVLPGPELSSAHARVLRQEVSAGGAAADPWVPLLQLPAAPADFTGREAECARLTGALATAGDQPGVPLVAISGSPGAGKTALALHVAHKVRASFPDGQLWVQLAGASARPRDPVDVLGDLLRVLGMSGSAIPDGCPERSACYRSRIAGRKILVVADDAATAAQLRPLLPGTAGCALLVTSRTQLEGLSGAHLMPLDVMTKSDATGLLTKIVGPDRIAAESDAADELAEACGALPLALRIAGAKLAGRPSWPLSVMVRRINREHSRLREFEAGDLSVRASIASSYESLPERPRRAFRLLALLGPADFAEWVIGVLLGEPGIADVADELISRSLLTPMSVDATGEPRYRLHDLLRDYASERLADDPADSIDAARERLLRGWFQLAQLAVASLPPEPYFPASSATSPSGVIPESEALCLCADPIAWFTVERMNLLAAVEQACAAGSLDLARQLASCQCAFQHLQDRHDDAERMWRMIADSADQSEGHRAEATYAQLRVAASMVERGQAAEALAILCGCVQAAEHLEEQETLAFALYWRGSCAFDLDDFESARSDADRGVRVALRAGSRLAELTNLRLLGIALAWRGDGRRAIAANEQAVAIATDLHVGPYELAALHNLAFSCTLAGQNERAIGVCTRRIELSRELGDVRGEALSHGVLGDAYYGLGEHELAVRSFLRALPVFRDHHARRFHALCLLKIGRAYRAMGSEEAIGYLEASLAMFRDLRLPRKAELAQQALNGCRAATRS